MIFVILKLYIGVVSKENKFFVIYIDICNKFFLFLHICRRSLIIDNFHYDGASIFLIIE